MNRRQTVSRLRGNRIETPNNWDKLTPQQKRYVESILSGPRSDITGPFVSLWNPSGVQLEVVLK